MCVSYGNAIPQHSYTHHTLYCYYWLQCKSGMYAVVYQAEVVMVKYFRHEEATQRTQCFSS